MPKLIPTDLADLQRSGISDEMAHRMGVYSLDRQSLVQALDRTDLDNGETGYVIPYFTRDGQPRKVFNVRLHKGIATDRPDKRIKYCKPPHTENLVYFPPGVDDLLKTKDYVIITEGEKKAAKAVQEGFPCVAIPGVWNWFDNQARALEKQEGLKISCRTRPLDDLMGLAYDKRVLLIFDSDAVHNDQVRMALRVLSDSLLFHTNGWVRSLWIPGGADAKMGIDDYLLQDQGPDLFQQLLIKEIAMSSDVLTPLLRFPYAESSGGKKLHYLIPNAPLNATLDIHRVLKQVEVNDSDGNPTVVTKTISNTRVWLNRVVHSIDDDMTLYEMAYVPLAANEIRYLSGGSELINLSNRGVGDVYSDRGAPVLTKDRPNMEEFFHHCQTYGVRTGVVKRVAGTRRRGWLQYNDDQMYLLASKVYTRRGVFASVSRDVPLLPIDAGAGDFALREALRTRGDHSVWKDVMLRFVLPNPTPTLYTAAGLAGLLRHWCPDSENFIVHLYNDSSSGKTTALRAAAGLWGNPGKLIDMWRTTDNGLEGRCLARNDMALFLDEAGIVTHEDILKNSVYMIGNGGEKMRASRDGSQRQARQFQLVALSTGERALLRGERHAGQEVRVLEIPTNITGGFWDKSIHSSAEAEKLNAALLENYGFAADLAIRFILQQEQGHPGFFKQLHNSLTEGLRKSLDPSTPPHILRRVKHYGLLLAALYVLLRGSMELDETDTGRILNDTRISVAQFMLQMSTDQFSGGEKQGMLDHLLSAVASGEGLHFHTADQPAKGDAWGMMHEQAENGLVHLVSVIPSAMAHLCKPYDASRILSVLDSMGALNYGKSRKDKKISVRMHQHVLSCYQINMSKVRQWMEAQQGSKP